MAIYEALATGLPVITTPNCGSVVRDGVDGYIVPIRNAKAIAHCATQLAANHDLLRAMSQAARARSGFVSLEAYGERLCAALGIEPSTGNP